MHFIPNTVEIPYILYKEFIEKSGVFINSIIFYANIQRQI